MRPARRAVPFVLALSFMACGDENNGGAAEPRDPDTAARVAVDRFSDAAATLMVRDDANGLPAANAPVDFDQGPFVTQGFGPDGSVVRYYNFDVQPVAPAPIYVLFRDGQSSPVEGQLNIIDVVPGDAGYNDFWRVHRVVVPDDYVANTVTSLAEIEDAAFAVEQMPALVNCPVVPDGSVATERFGGGAAGLSRGWHRGEVVTYFTFEERPLSVTGDSEVPLSPIYVTFNVNPDQPDGGPPSGFVTEPDSSQTHNVVATVPSGDGYSPLWRVNVYDNADFDSVSDLGSALDASLLGENVANVNCPVVSVE